MPLRWEVSHQHLSGGSRWVVAGEGHEALSITQSLPSGANSLAEEKGKMEKVQISVEWGRGQGGREVNQVRRPGGMHLHSKPGFPRLQAFLEPYC